mmetsp:Transcript_25296/g.55045  ORF Transcript_25296/g.55045 Transcript_25296/m.55045 type:complete len:650 (-) Transcript_25296:303-2252(-)|eukprot:CAMPEP_0206465584 /NCGR_PEP_ID=MMETSP0324_2-20121206/27926_1 /ASSEMBLY_ACC=CAM_ASM_000836 /TAXON_ID=2866 /ORGANISM="Crypthecodinium cohnii, Strain Seligo" /LENGTH=649 /DNA_ID=CAMNT_0053938489 /DNA_START=93 /DNA_END=2042 /DNA_ORIENTATION=+
MSLSARDEIQLVFEAALGSGARCIPVALLERVLTRVLLTPIPNIRLLIQQVPISAEGQVVLADFLDFLFADSTEAFDKVSNETRDTISADYLGHPLRGVSVHYLTSQWLIETEAVGLSRDAKVYDIEPLVIRAKGEGQTCPRDSRPGAAYVDCLHGKDNVGLATVMLSYTWGYTVGDIADCLQSFCITHSLDPKRTYVWICCLCINQHRVKESQAKGVSVPFETFRREFGERVEGIGQVLAMMSPWYAPRYLTRVWCDFELYVATSLISSDKCKLHVGMPPSQEKGLFEALSHAEGTVDLWKSLLGIRIEYAEASVAEDKDRILTLISDGPGFHELNSKVALALQQWMMDTCYKEVELRRHSGTLAGRELARACRAIGKMMLKVTGQGSEAEAYERMADLVKIGTDALKDAGEEETVTGVDLICLGARVVNFATKKSADAKREYHRAQHVLEKIGATVTPTGAGIEVSFGDLAKDSGQYEKALEHYNRAKQLFEQGGMERYHGYAAVLREIGSAKKRLKDYAGALEEFKAARNLMTELGTADTKDGSTLIELIGITKYTLGDLTGGLDEIECAIQLREQLGLGRTTAAVWGIFHQGTIKKKLGQFKDAAKVFEKAIHTAEAGGHTSTMIYKKCKGELSALQQSLREGEQ